MDVLLDAITGAVTLYAPQIWTLGGIIIGLVVIFALVRYAQKRVKSAIK